MSSHGQTTHYIFSDQICFHFYNIHKFRQLIINIANHDNQWFHQTLLCENWFELEREFQSCYKSAIKRRSTLGGLDQYTTPNTKLNTLEMSALPPPPPKEKQKQNKLFIVAMSCKVSNTTNTCSNKNCHTVKQSHCHFETVYDQLNQLTEYGEWLENWLISSPMSPEAQLSSLSLFSDTVRLSCAFALLFMVHFQFCFLSIYKMLCIANIDFLDD